MEGLTKNEKQAICRLLYDLSKIDGSAKQSELDYIHNVLKEDSQFYSDALRYPLADAVRIVTQEMRFENRVQLSNHLLALAKVDGAITELEDKFIETLFKGMGIFEFLNLNQKLQKDSNQNNMGWFSNTNTSGKQAEIEQLLNETMKATFQWEQAGEKSYGDEMINAANAVRNNTPKIVQLYADLIKAHGSRNLNIRNRAIPQMPSEINIQMAIMGIFQFAEALGNKNPSFRNGLVSADTLQKFSRIMAGH